MAMKYMYKYMKNGVVTTWKCSIYIEYVDEQYIKHVNTDDISGIYLAVCELSIL